MLQLIACDKKPSEQPLRKVNNNDPSVVSGDTMRPRASDSETLIPNTTLIMRLVNSVIYDVFNLLADEKLLSNRDIKAIRQVCWIWQQIIDGALSNNNSLLQQQFLVNLINIQQLTAFVYMQSISNTGNRLEIINQDHLSQLGFNNNLTLEEFMRVEFVVKRNLDTNIAIKLTNNQDIDILLDLINQKCIVLSNISSISFGDIVLDNIEKVNNLLLVLFLNEKILFSKFKKLVFGNIFKNIIKDIELIIPGFKRLETLLFEGVFDSLKIQYCPMLKNLNYRSSTQWNVILIKEIAELNKLKLKATTLHHQKMSQDFIDDSQNILWLKHVEIVVIDTTKNWGFEYKQNKSYEYAQQFINCIYSKQNLFVNLKQIILIVDDEVSKENLSQLLQLPESLKPMVSVRKKDYLL